MQDHNIPAEAETSEEKNDEAPHRGRNFTIPQPIAEGLAVEETSENNSQAAGFIDSVKKFFAPCVGAVDAASIYIGECRPSNLDQYDSNEQGENVAEDVIMRLRKRNAGFGQQTMKRRSETLEIPTNGILFDDDDVSAISSHTLEEMERLRLAQNRSAKFHLSPKPSDRSVGQKAGMYAKQTWNIQRSTATNDATTATNELAICVSVSDSSSSEGIEQPKKDIDRGSELQPTWGDKNRKLDGFKTHAVG